MGGIIDMFGNPHQQIQKLLPWYANGTLDPGERQQVEDHLAGCADCQAELHAEQMLKAQLAAMPAQPEPGWAALRSRLDLTPIPKLRFSGRIAQLGRALAGPGGRFWFLTGQLAAILLAVIVLRPLEAPAAYHALGGAPPAATGNAIVMFNPDLPERDLRAALERSEARLVGGPTATGAYLVQFPDEHRSQRIEMMRRQRGVMIAEPVDAGAS